MLSHFMAAWTASRWSHRLGGRASWFETEISSTDSCCGCLFPSGWHYVREGCRTFWSLDLAHRSRSVGARSFTVVAWPLVLALCFLLCEQLLSLTAAVSWAAWPCLPHLDDSETMNQNQTLSPLFLSKSELINNAWGFLLNHHGYP